MTLISTTAFLVGEALPYLLYKGVSEDVCYSLLRGVIILLKGVLRIELCMKVHRSINKKIFTIKNKKWKIHRNSCRTDLKEEVEAITNKKRMMLLIPFVYRSFDVVDRGIEPLCQD